MFPVIKCSKGEYCSFTARSSDRSENGFIYDSNDKFELDYVLDFHSMFMNDGKIDTLQVPNCFRKLGAIFF